MWDAILNKFKKYPAQERVVRLLLERGFQVTPDGKVVSGGIRLAHTQIAREASVDRRAVDGAALMIIEDPLLKIIFTNIRPISSLREVAPDLKLGVIVITPVDAARTGILASGPTLTIITDRQIPDDLVGELLKCEGVQGISVC
jgi:predicted regulator of amino acid metabolism with ACT domain